MSKINSNKLWNMNLWNDSGLFPIILNQHFCFIQIPKTSSTNVLENCEKKKLCQLLPCYRHEGLLFIEQYIDTNLPIYTIVRNPFVHIYSYFFHTVRHNEIQIDPNTSIITNFENFCRSHCNNIHLQQYNYIRSNKNLNVKIFKLEEGVDKFNDYILKNHNIDLELNKSHLNKNIIKDENVDIKSFFTNKEIVDLIIKERYKEFEFFNYSIDINDI